MGGQSRGGIVGFTVGGNKISDNFDITGEFYFYFTSIEQILKDEIPQTNVSPHQYISDKSPGFLIS